MASKKGNGNNYKQGNNNSKKENVAIKEEVKKFPSNDFVRKAFIFMGTVFFILALLYLMNYFFIEHNNILVNMSTDKKVEYIKISGKDELITTQKYVSDLDYSMRYDVNNFTVFKYKTQDIFKFINEEKILVIVEKDAVPGNCSKTTLDNEYNSCVVKVDNYSKEYYISTNKVTYKITVKTPNTGADEENIMQRINYMLNSFEMKS